MVEPIIDMNTATADATPPAVPDTLPVGKTQDRLLPTQTSVDPLSAEAYQRVVSGETSLYKKRIAEEERDLAGESAASKQYDARLERMLHAEGATVDDLKPWNAQTMAPPPTNLWEKFGSPGFVIGMLASSFTGMPMVSALNAGAAAMNAINEGDDANYHRAFDTWKVNSELAIKRFNMEKQAFDQIAELRRNNIEEWHAKATALAARFNDERMQVLLQNGMYPEAIKAQEALATSVGQIQDVKKKIEDNATRMAIIHSITQDEDGKLKPEYAKDPKKFAEAAKLAETAMKDESTPLGIALRNLQLSDEYQNAGSAEREEMIAKVVRDLSQAQWYGRGTASAGAENVKDREAVKADVRKEHPDWSEGKVTEETNKRIAESKTVVTANKRLDAESHIRQYKMGIDLVDGITATLEKYAGAAGLAGRATRLAERVDNIFGGDETDRVQMMRDIEQLQLMGPRLLLDQRTGRPLSVEAGHINDIIGGLNMGDTTANTLRSMKEIRARLEELMKGNVESLERDPANPASKEPAKTETKDDKPWENDPAIH